MPELSITPTTARRYILGRQGLWPGRRWQGLNGTAQALHTTEAVQIDPLVVVARNHDLILHSRVIDYQPEHLDRLLYHDRAFFDYGGTVFIYPMDELPYWRVVMRRKGQEPRWSNFARQNPALLKEVQAEHARPAGQSRFRWTRPRRQLSFGQRHRPGDVLFVAERRVDDASSAQLRAGV
jgi:uncharacterized protein YcaQ